MDPLRPQIGPCGIGMGPLKLAISLFSRSVDSGRRQLLIVKVENEPTVSERRVDFSHFHPICVHHCDTVR